MAKHSIGSKNSQVLILERLARIFEESVKKLIRTSENMVLRTLEKADLRDLEYNCDASIEKADL
jgi:hypothetical protein